VIPPELVAIGVRFYDALRAEHSEYDARQAAVCYMRRKCPELEGDAMPFHEALADALATRAADRIKTARLVHWIRTTPTLTE
jgi:hypothetical protein